MANRYWILGTGTWDASTTTHWSTSSGGSGGASVPGTSDTAIFDANSGGGTVTTSSASAVGGLTMTGAASMTFSGDLTVQGAITLSSTVTFSSGTITQSGAGAKNLTFSGATLYGYDCAQGTVTLQDAFSSSSTFTVSGGTFDANNKNVDFGGFSSTGSTTRTITMGSGTWSTTASSPWTISGTNCTLNCNTSQLNISKSSTGTIALGDKTYYNVNLNPNSGTPVLSITGSNTFNNLSVTASQIGSGGMGIKFDASSTNTFTTFSVSGYTSSKNVSITSSSGGTAGTLSAASGTITCYNLSIQDSAATGGAVWQAISSTDVSGNSGWIFRSNLSGMFEVFN